jgi:hypothetical protein
MTTTILIIIFLLVVIGRSPEFHIDINNTTWFGVIDINALQIKNDGRAPEAG